MGTGQREVAIIAEAEMARMQHTGTTALGLPCTVRVNNRANSLYTLGRLAQSIS